MSHSPTTHLKPRIYVCFLCGTVVPHGTTCPTDITYGGGKNMKKLYITRCRKVEVYERHSAP